MQRVSRREMRVLLEKKKVSAFAEITSRGWRTAPKSMRPYCGRCE